MTWDFAEGNAFSSSSGSWDQHLDWITRVLDKSYALLPKSRSAVDFTESIVSLPVQDDVRNHPGALVSSDPPYYDNIGYANLSDFFYVWLQRALGGVHPDLFREAETPKNEEMIADPYRKGSKQNAKEFFEAGMRTFFAAVAAVTPKAYPATLIYAYKQQDQKDDPKRASQASFGNVEASTGWETFLHGLIEEGLTVTATWPLRTELANRSNGQDTNALAGSIVLAVRPRGDDPPTTDRRGLLRALKAELPAALRELTRGGLPPVDLAQAAIGPGMAVFSRYAAVTEPDGRPLRVRDALKIVNEVLAEVLEEGEGDLDPVTRFALTWFATRRFESGPYGDAETLGTAKGVPVARVAESGVVLSGSGKVRLWRLEELDPLYDPAADARPTLWEAVHHLAKRQGEGGNAAAARLLRRYRDAAPSVDVDLVRDLAYRLYAICDAKRWSAEARPYNALASEWGAIEDASREDAAAWASPTGERGLFDA